LILSRRHFLTSMILAGFVLLGAGQSVSEEYQVKALFLFNFAQFVKWPSSDFSSANEPFRIGVLGENPFGTFLSETVKGESVEGHPLVVQHYDSPAAVKDCKILFVSDSEKEAIGQILAALKDRDVLTVGDTPDFLKEGGIIRFVPEGNKIHFRVGLDRANNLKFSISSKVLRLADPGKD